MRFVGMVVLLLWCACSQAQTVATDFPDIFQIEVKKPLQLTPLQIEDYRSRMVRALADARAPAAQEFVVLIDRNPSAQRAMVFIGTSTQALFVGATKTSTGDVGRFDYYVTPVGVFEHTLLSDFRAEGTKNDHGVRGYGAKGMRIWDFGWQKATKGWGEGFARREETQIRLQLHATDPDLLESRLGHRASKGCLRIPSTLNHFLDKFGALDAYYDALAASGKRPWVWGPEHMQTPFSGRYLVVVDSSASPQGL